MLPADVSAAPITRFGADLVWDISPELTAELADPFYMLYLTVYPD